MDFTKRVQSMERRMKEAQQKAVQMVPRGFLSDDSDDGWGFSSSPGCSYSVAQSHTYVKTSSGGKPRVYQESSMARSGPGGVKEMKKVVQDSEKGKKLCVGRALGEKAHVVRRAEDKQGVVEEHQDLYNLDEDGEELKQFHKEWETRKSSLPEYRFQSYKKITKK